MVTGSFGFLGGSGGHFPKLSLQPGPRGMEWSPNHWPTRVFQTVVTVNKLLALMSLMYYVRKL